MNPTHVFLIALLALISWVLGFLAGDDTENDVWPNAPSAILATALLLTVVVSLARIIYLSL